VISSSNLTDKFSSGTHNNKWKFARQDGDSDEEDYDLENKWTMAALVTNAVGTIYS
jgi:hypothetical protein